MAEEIVYDVTKLSFQDTVDEDDDDHTTSMVIRFTVGGVQPVRVNIPKVLLIEAFRVWQTLQQEKENPEMLDLAEDDSEIQLQKEAPEG